MNPTKTMVDDLVRKDGLHQKKPIWLGMFPWRKIIVESDLVDLIKSHFVFPEYCATPRQIVREHNSLARFTWAAGGLGDPQGVAAAFAIEADITDWVCQSGVC